MTYDNFYDRDARQAETRAALATMAAARPQATARQRDLDVTRTAKAVVRHATRAANSFKGAANSQRQRLEAARDTASDILAIVKTDGATTEHGLRLARAVSNIMQEAICYCGNGAAYMTAIDGLRDAQDDAGLIARGCALREPHQPGASDKEDN